MEKLPSTDAERRYGFAGSCEIMYVVTLYYLRLLLTQVHSVKKRAPNDTALNATPVEPLGSSTKPKPTLPFSAALCDWLQEYFHLIPHWLVHRKNDTGVALVAGDASHVKSTPAPGPSG